MKVSGKFIIFLGLCVVCFIAFGLPEQACSVPKGKIVVAQGGDATTLDPHMFVDNLTWAVNRNIYDYLMRRVFRDGKIQHLPMLATSWEATNDTTWIFHLRKGVKFHNGEDFNAEAVKYSIERVLNPAQKAKYRWAIAFIDRVDVVDPYTVKIITKVPAPTIIINLGWTLSIAPPKYFKEKGDEYVSTHPIGTGPFKFVRWKKDEEIVLEANENYWAGAPKIKNLIFKPIPEDSTRIAALLGGDVDIAKKVPAHLITMVNKSNTAKVVTTPSGLSICVYLNTLKEGPLEDKRVRQAINYAVDKESIIKHVLEGYGKPLGSPLNPAHFGYDPSIKPYPYDPQKAMALLKEAGYGNGLTLTFNSPSGRYDRDKEFAEAIAGQLAKVGINVKLQFHEWGGYMAKLISREAGPMYTNGWAGTFDADGLFFPLLHCNEPLSTWCNKQFDSYLDQARSILDQKKREKLYHEASKLCHDEAPALFLHYGVDIYGVSNRVQNFNPTPDEPTSLYMLEKGVKD